jgi:hypothetical protein
VSTLCSYGLRTFVVDDEANRTQYLSRVRRRCLSKFFLKMFHCESGLRVYAGSLDSSFSWRTRWRCPGTHKYAVVIRVPKCAGGRSNTMFHPSCWVAADRRCRILCPGSSVANILISCDNSNYIAAVRSDPRTLLYPLLETTKDWATGPCFWSDPTDLHPIWITFLY